MTIRILEGDCRDVLKTLPDASVHCCVTSPPYFGLRDYGVDGQMGLELTPDEYIAGMVAVFREVRRVLRDDGTLWLNIGDSYARTGGTDRKVSASAQVGSTRNTMEQMSDRTSKASALGLKDKDLVGIPWMLAFALRADGWYLRQDIIWSKPNPMPESVRDRCTKAHEYLFLLSKSERYYFDADAIAEPCGWDPTKSKMPDGWDTGPCGHGAFHRNGREAGKRRVPGNVSHKQTAAYEAGDERLRTKAGLVDFAERERAKVASGDLIGTRNKRSVWTIATQPFKEAHFATFPPALVEPCILAGCPVGGVVLDPFGGAGTTGLVADRLQRSAILIELNAEYAAIARRRVCGDSPLFSEVG
jgi:DNA modification methylase